MVPLMLDVENVPYVPNEVDYFSRQRVNHSFLGAENFFVCMLHLCKLARVPLKTLKQQ